METTPSLTLANATAQVEQGCHNLIVRALVNDLAAARVRIAELEQQLQSAAGKAAKPADAKSKR